jgi:hypothetical protein
LKRLVILSDINGHFLQGENRPTRDFKQFDAVDMVNSVTLAGLDNKDELDNHQKFIEGGIDFAATQLIAKYPFGITAAFGLSVGGVILWRAAIRGLAIRKLVCFSSTRLRFEKEAPPCETELYFGETDVFKPDDDWFEQLSQKRNLLPGYGHEFYREQIGIQLFNDIAGRIV